MYALVRLEVTSMFEGGRIVRGCRPSHYGIQDPVDETCDSGEDPRIRQARVQFYATRARLRLPLFADAEEVLRTGERRRQA